MAAKKKAEDFITYGDGFADIEMQGSALMGGIKQSVLRMREPTVADQEAAELTKGTDSVIEKMLFANLLGYTPDDMRGLTIRNYKRVQAAFLGFID